MLKVMISICTIILFSACEDLAKEPANETPNINLATTSSKLSRLSPSIEQNSTTALVDGLNTFAFDMYSGLQKEYQGQNIFFSPISISTALAMLYPGARGDTKSEMSTALHFTMPDTELLSTFNVLDASLNQQSENYIFKEVNALWPDATFKIKTDYLDAIMQNFGAGLYPLDFLHHHEESRLTINKWVEENTNRKIVDLLKEGDIIPDTRLVLTNAVYFNAQWVDEFEESSTTKSPFYVKDGSSVTVPMMSQISYFNYGESNDAKIIELLYSDYNTSMLIVMPNEGSWESFTNSFNLSLYNSMIKQMSSKNIELYMPKYKFKTPPYSLKRSLSVLGMKKAFEDSADFKNIADEFIKVGDVLHKAFISVDEKGTEAAAATAITMIDTAIMMPEDVMTLRIERPFILFIRNRVSGQILFMGEILNPIG